MTEKKLKEILIHVLLITLSVFITKAFNFEEAWVGFFVAMSIYIILHCSFKLLLRSKQ